MKLGLHQSARLEQRLMQSPQMIQAMQILQLGALELEGRIEQELLENPLLEPSEPAPTSEEKEGSAPEEVREDQGDRDSMRDAMESMEWDYGDGRRVAPASGDEDPKYEALQNTADTPHTMAEALADQAIWLDLSEDERIQLDFLLWSLDEHGYLRQGLTLLAEQMQEALGKPIDRLNLASMLHRLRQATHPALGATDLKDCLSLQLEAKQVADPLLWSLIEDHLEDLQANRLPRIAKATGADLDEIKLAIEQLRHLDPYPGTDFGGQPATSIVPDVMVEEIEGEWTIRLGRNRGELLTLSDEYLGLLKQKESTKEAKAWLSKRRDQAQWFIDALKQRHSTLQKVALRIFSRQEDFLRHGKEALKPLRMQEVADDLGVHISTISRTVAGKYAQTPLGIFPLKFFFTGGTTTDTGNQTSQVSVQELVRQMIESEDKEHPLSDEALAKLMQEKEGIQIARRTVTKYRKALGLPSSSGRKKY
ncbi:MAG: RNA polymerase factor sigma-54 [Planctomycetota bacterium]|nr:RNA polymerase factor sigma-54 [Planctomycetota bacterium]